MSFIPGDRIRVTGETPGCRDVVREYTVEKMGTFSYRRPGERRHFYMVRGKSGAYLALRPQGEDCWCVTGYRRCSRVTYVQYATVEVTQ